MSSQITISSTGITVPQASDIKTAFQGVFTNAFGSDLSLDDATPQGELIDDLTEVKQEANTRDLYLFNQFNPETAEGIFQDALGAIYGMKRKEATHSVVSCQCVGVPNTVLDSTAMAQNTNGDVFRCLENVTIPLSGRITVQFESVETGKIPCGANTVNKIYTVVSGWQDVNNETAGTEGQEEESRLDFESRRKKELSRNAVGTIGAVLSAVWETEGVTDVSIEQNRTSSSITKRGVTLSPHSIYLCVNGGEPDDIAQAIFYSLSGGCDTTSTLTSITGSYTDPYSGVSDKYNIDRPTYKTVYIKVSIDESISDETKDKIRSVIMSDYNGETDDESITIGSSVYASRFYADIAKLSISGLALVSVKISGGGSSSVTVTGTGITDASVNNVKFQSAVSDTAGTYTFTYDGTKWELSSEEVNLSDYGITPTGTASSGDEIEVVWTASSWFDLLTYNINELPVIEDSTIIFEVV